RKAGLLACAGEGAFEGSQARGAGPFRGPETPGPVGGREERAAGRGEPMLEKVDHPVELRCGENGAPSWPGAPHALGPAHLHGPEVPVRRDLWVGAEVDVLQLGQFASSE